MSIALFLYGVNNVLYGNLIWDNAYKKQSIGKYNTAIGLYDLADNYYRYSRFVPTNETRFFSVPTQKAYCYLNMRRINEADNSIKMGMYRIVDMYGLTSYDYLDYVLEDVVDYYLQNKNYKSAYEYLKMAEYLSAKVKSDGREYVLINGLYGDLFLARNKKDVALKYYESAYDLLSKYQNLRTDLVIQTTKKLGSMYILMNKSDLAVNLYSKLLDSIQTSKESTKEQLALSKWLIATAYAAQDRDQMAISYYDEAYSVISNLPPSAVSVKNINDLRLDMMKSYNAIGRFGMVQKLQNEILNNI